LKKYIRDYLTLFLAAGFIIGLDQLTKSLVRQNLAISEVWSPWPWLTPYARIVHWYNTGVALGFFQGKGDIFAILAFVVAVVIIFYFPRVPKTDWSLRLAMCLQLGGAVGNLVDRILFDGIVTDFISVGNFPVFNIADSSITIGVVVLLLGVYFQERKEKKNKLTVDSNPPAAKNNDLA
jgi:signal peptidase II